MIKAAAAAASEPGTDLATKITQRHFEAAMEDVIAARSIMRQSILMDEIPPTPNVLPALDVSRLWLATIAGLALGGVALVASAAALWFALR